MNNDADADEGARTEPHASETLTADGFRTMLAKLRQRFPRPFVFIHGVDFGEPPFNGPLGVSSHEFAGLLISGWIEYEPSAAPTIEGRWIWTDRAIRILEQVAQ